MRVFMLGAGGHARSVADALGGTEIEAAVVVRRTGDEDFGTIASGLITEDELIEVGAADVRLVNGIGQTTARGPRWEAYRRFRDLGFTFSTVVHPSATVSRLANLSDGVQILAAAVVGPGAVLGANTLVNTAAIVEHGCIVGSGVHIASGAVVCGDVAIGDGSMVSAGATIVPGRTMGAGSQLGAGAVLVGDIPADHIYVGVPARRHGS